MAYSVRRPLLRSLAVLFCGAVAVRCSVWVMSPSPAGLGVLDHRLAVCPDRPNCVSTFSQAVEHRIDPIPFRGSPDDLIQKLKTIVTELPRTRVVRQASNYLHVECRSLWFGFVDDVEFLVDVEQQLIQFRSASRVGYSDLGVNRQRMETIRRACHGTL